MESQPAWPPCPRSSPGALQASSSQGREALAAAQGPAGTQHGSLDPQWTVTTNETEQLNSEGCDCSTEPSRAAGAGGSKAGA